ncbi:DNA polymerase III subunit epsilon [Actinocatenispora sera]|uniref:DNA polymerase III subunit epsilon n=1 Tax=Actinocatenispora sera TaxID=390989 RepID=A0A810L0V4_9ACTN|nr:DNA polymerase III subunit epsilon [Actinocatenispora sera]
MPRAVPGAASLSSYPAPTVPYVPVPPVRRSGEPAFRQQSIDEIGQPLATTTFVVVDLETTGGSPADAGITEIGAVKVCGGEVLGEFGTLVNPGLPIPPFVAALTGITEAMVAPAPALTEALPSFLEFARGAVLVAHNAPFDVGFLKAACAKFGYPWPGFPVVDTVTLARRALTRDEVPNCKLATLAAHFHTATQPSHRALDDARATVDVLHRLLERVGSHQVHTLDELVEFCRAVHPVQRRKRGLADGLPHAPGVYVFRDGSGRPLYVGTSRDIATRVRSYFTAAETRSRMTEMLTAAERVEAVECAHALEAGVRELRLIATHKPPYNRRSKFPERVHWLKLTDEPFPRLSIVRKLADDAGCYLGPFSSRRTAETAAAGVYDAVPLRQCTRRLSVRTASPACALAEIGRCAAPCELQIAPADYARHADAFRDLVHGDPAVLVDRLLARIGELATDQRYEEAATVRGRLVALLRAAVRLQRLRSLTSIPELVAARRADDGGWELAVVRYGRLAAAGTAPRGTAPRPVLAALLATAETVRGGVGPTPCATGEETELILAFLNRPETRLVESSGAGWCCPASGAERFHVLLQKADAARSSTDPLSDRGGPRTIHRPTRATA